MAASASAISTAADSGRSAGAGAFKAPPGYVELDTSIFRVEHKLRALRIPAAATSQAVAIIKRKTWTAPRIPSVQHDGDDFRAVLLAPAEKEGSAGAASASGGAPSERSHQLTAEELSALAALGGELIDRDIVTGYDHMSCEDVLKHLLAPSGAEQIPASFEAVGGLAHLNLRPEVERWKYAIGRVLLDKNPGLRTVVNKTGVIDTTFRTFPMEVLAGEPSTEVEVRHAGARFTFDFARVYWNTRLAGEHERVASKVIPRGSTVADMFAGVGPFAIPLSMPLRGCIVHGNDLNPASHTAMVANAARNKIPPTSLVAYNADGRDFIRGIAAAGVPFQYVLMNLPADAVSFLDVFVGLFATYGGGKSSGSSTASVAAAEAELPPTVAAVTSVARAAATAPATARAAGKGSRAAATATAAGGAAAAAPGAPGAAAAPSATAAVAVQPSSASGPAERPRPTVLCYAFCKTHTFDDAAADVTRRILLRMRMLHPDHLPFVPPCYDHIGNDVLRKQAVEAGADAGAAGGAGAAAAAAAAAAAEAQAQLKFKSSLAKAAVPPEVRAAAAAARGAVHAYARSVLPDLEVREVRNVAPNKVMVVAQFTVPHAVLYADAAALGEHGVIASADSLGAAAGGAGAASTSAGAAGSAARSAAGKGKRPSPSATAGAAASAGSSGSGDVDLDAADASEAAGSSGGAGGDAASSGEAAPPAKRGRTDGGDADA